MKITVGHILSEAWLIDKSIISSYLPNFINFLNGKASGTFEKDDPKFFCVNRNLTDRWELKWNSDNIPSDTVLILELNGPLFTYEYEMYTQALQLAAQNPNIISVLLLMNTPGGMVRGIEGFTNEILNCPKPINALVRLAASAGEWIVSGAKFIGIEGNLSEMGSLGVYTTWMDIKKYYKLEHNLNVIDYYATKSTRKNEEVRQLEESEGENSTLLTARLDYINEQFHQFVSKNRNISLDSEVFTGAMYYAPDAIKNKLADKQMSFAEAVEKTYIDGIKASLTQTPNLNRI